MNFEELMKVIEDEVNTINYNSDIILINTNTNKKLIIPKQTPKPINFFDIPLDIRQIIYNKVKVLKFDELSSYNEAKVEISFKLRRKQMENVNFINDDNDNDKIPEKKLSYYEREIERENSQKKQKEFLKNIADNSGNIREKIIYRDITSRNINKDIFYKIVIFKFIYNEKNKKIDHIITKDILQNEYLLLKYQYNNHEIIEDDRNKINNNYRVSKKYEIDYRNFLDKNDEKFIKINSDYEKENNEISDIFCDTLSEYLVMNREREMCKKKYNEK